MKLIEKILAQKICKKYEKATQNTLERGRNKKILIKK